MEASLEGEDILPLGSQPAVPLCTFRTGQHAQSQEPMAYQTLCLSITYPPVIYLSMT